MSQRWRVLSTIAVTFVMTLALPQAAEATTGAGPYLTLLFSRSAVTASSNCVVNDTGVARLDTVVAPELSSLGLHPTGSIETRKTQEDSLWCGHYKETRFSSWSLAEQLASRYGWSFISHSATRPDNETSWSALSSQGIYDETCGSAQQITAHGLPGANGSFAWPNGYVHDPAMSYVQACFDFSRTYGMNGVTDQATATVAPYNEPARGVNGGACNDPSVACYTYTFANAPSRYRSPVAVSEMIASAQSSQWITLQTYLLVTGSRAGLWDCTSPDWHQHWTYDTERYCWNDYLSIVSALPAAVRVTDPASVGAAWGRVAPGHLPTASIRLSPTTSRIETGATRTYTAKAYDPLGNDLGDVTDRTTFTVDDPGICTANSCGADVPGTYTVTGTVDGVRGTAQLTVGSPPASIVLSPTTSTITAGSVQTYAAEGYDPLGNDLGDVTAETVFTVDGGGSCTGNACGATQPGSYTITGTNGGVSGTAQLTVVTAVTISSFTPGRGAAGTTVTISGSGFSGASGVTFGGTSASFTVASPTQVTATVPWGATTGPISVTTPDGSATSASSFAVLPTISSFTPTGGPVGTVVTINGGGFTGTTAVRFGGAPSAFSVVSRSKITATLPPDAITGKITVVTPSGSASTGSNFQVKPTISGFTPWRGPVGTVVTINGSGFAGATAVKFRSTVSSFTIVSSTQLRATVPVGATTGAISVSTRGGTAWSAANFRVTR